MALRDDMLAAQEAYFFNPDYFGEEVTFYPAGGGPPRTLQANIVKRGSSGVRDSSLYREDELTVSVAKDPDADTGGILEPQLGDRIMRGAAVDPSQRSFSWTGDHDGDHSDVYWILRYARETNYRQGSAHTMEQ